MSPPLRQEFDEAIAVVQGDVQVLVVEHAVLDGGDIEVLGRSGTRKQTLMQQLDHLDAEHRLPAHEELKVEAAPDPDWTAIVQSLQHCHRPNQRNGGLVSRRLQLVRQALAVLTGTDSGSGLYDRSGELLAGARSRPLAAA